MQYQYIKSIFIWWFVCLGSLSPKANNIHSKWIQWMKWMCKHAFYKCIFCSLFFFRRIQKLATFWLNIRFRRIYEFDKCWSVFFAGFSLFGFVYSTKNDVLFSAALRRTGGVQRNNIAKTDRLWHLHTVMHKLNTKNWMGYFGSMDSNKYISCTLFHFMTTLYVYVIDGIYDLNWHDANE